MTDDERRIYKYLIAKKDNASARKYLLDKMSDLESRKAYAVAGSNEGGFIGTVKDFSTAAKSGLESGLTNMARMGVAGNIAAGNNMGVLNKLLEPTYSEKLYEQVRANAKDKGYVYGVLLDATNSIAAQLPQIAMGAAGGSGAYLSAMALQIIGADTTEAINQGYDGMRGVVYGIFDTALEFATEKVLGGIASKLDGGETSRLVRAALNAVDSTVSNKKVANALAKTISVLSSANSEGVEEFLQAVIEPVMRNVIYGERNNLNAETFKEAVRAYIVGAVSGGIMDIPFANNTLENTRADITGKFLKENAGVESVLKLSEVVGNNSELYGEIKSSFDGGRDVSNTDLAMLYQQSAIMFEQPSEETYKNFAERNVDALIKEAVNRQSNESKPDSESAKYMAESATQTDTVNSFSEVNLDTETGAEYNYDRGEQNVREKTLRDGSGRVWRENNNSESGTGAVQKTDVGSFGEDQTAYARKEFTAGRSQSVRDSIGRGIRLTSEQIESLKSTAIKNNDGNPKEVFHFTDNMEFETFSKGDIGFHFGNEQQAVERGNILKKTGRIIKAYLDIKKPIHISSDIMNWKPMPLSFRLFTDGIITNDEYLTICEMQSKSGGDYNSPAAVELRRILSEKGYDGIAYENMFEGEGQSYIAFYPEQVIITDDGINADLNGSVSFSDKNDIQADKADTKRDSYAKDESFWTAENSNEKSEKNNTLVNKLKALFGNEKGDSTVSVGEIVKLIEKDFGIPVSKGKFRERAYGIYKVKAEAIRTKISNALPTIGHELGHHLDKKYNLRNFQSINEAMRVLKDARPNFYNSYSPEARPGEAVAEFIRNYLADRTPKSTKAVH